MRTKVGGMIQKCFTKYRDMKLKRQLSIMFTAIVLVFIAVFFACFGIYYKIQTRNWYDKTEQELVMIMSRVQNKCADIEKLTYNMVEDSQLQEVMRRVAENQASPVGYADESVLIDKVCEYTFREDAALSVGIFSSQIRQFYSREIDRGITGGKREQINQYSSLSGGGALWVQLDPDESVVACVREMKSTKPFGVQVLGTIIIEMNAEALINSFYGTKQRSENLIIMDSGTDHLIYSNLDVDEKKIPLIKDDFGSGEIVVSGRRFLYSYLTDHKTGWRFLSLTEYRKMFAETLLLQVVVLLICILVYILGLFLTLRFIRAVTTPLENLTWKMKQVGRGDFHVGEHNLVPNGSLCETVNLEYAFNRMVYKIDALIYNDYIKQIKLKEYELRSLQLEINPHFLYNTLDSIKWKARVCGQSDIVTMTDALGRLLRGVIRRDQSVILLEEEWKLLENYISIQKIRYEEQFEFEFSMMPGLGKNMVPKLLLQPIVENSIIYGMDKTVEPCKIMIVIRQRGNRLHFIISDNGSGMEESFVQRLGKGEIEPSGTGIGIKNIRERLRLLYGEQARIRMYSRLGKGTVVCVSLPCSGKGDLDEDEKGSYFG